MSGKNETTVEEKPVEETTEETTVEKPVELRVVTIEHGKLLIPQDGLTGDALVRAKVFKDLYDDLDKIFTPVSVISDVCLKPAKRINTTLAKMVNDSKINPDVSMMTGLTGKDKKPVRDFSVKDMLEYCSLVIRINADSERIAELRNPPEKTVVVTESKDVALIF